MTVAIALFTSPRWIAGYGDAGASDDDRDARAALADRRRPSLIYTQILVGATMRHTGAGWRFPTSR